MAVGKACWESLLGHLHTTAWDMGTKAIILRILFLMPVRQTQNAVCVDRYTLGGFYLAKYEDSPVGAFEEVSPFLRRIH